MPLEPQNFFLCFICNCEDHFHLYSLVWYILKQLSALATPSLVVVVVVVVVVLEAPVVVSLQTGPALQSTPHGRSSLEPIQRLSVVQFALQVAAPQPHQTTHRSLCKNVKQIRTA